MRYPGKHSIGLEEAIVRFLKTRQYHSRVPLTDEYDLCLMLEKCDYAVKCEQNGKTIKLCRRLD